MPRKPKAARIIPKLMRQRRVEQTDTTPVMDPDVRALTNFLRRTGVVCTTHSNPVLARIVVTFLTRRKRH